MAEIWSDLLRVGQIGAHHNFFELGGHSLLMMQVIARIRARFGVNINLRQFFEAPTVARLAEIVERDLAEEIGRLGEDEARQLVCAAA